VARTRIAELDQRIADLEAMRDSLGRSLATYELPRAERQCPLLESISADQGGGNDEH
jgi:hypothetical protein